MVVIAGTSAFEQAGVADQRDVGVQLVGVVLHERHQRGRAGFLLALEEEGDLAGQGAVHRLPGAAGLDEGHQLALVVAGAAAADHLALGRCPRTPDRTGRGPRAPADRPAARRSGRRTAGAAPSPSIWPTTIGWPGVGRFSAVDAKRLQIGHQPVGGAVAIGLEGRIGRNRRDPQQFHQAVGGGGQVAVDAGQNGVKGHGAAPEL